MKKKYNYINDDVKVDFLVPEKLQEIVDYLEELDADDNAAFYNYAESLEYVGRDYVESGEISKNQWRTLCNRYGGF